MHVEQQHAPLRAPLWRHGPALSPDTTQTTWDQLYSLLIMWEPTRPGREAMSLCHCADGIGHATAGSWDSSGSHFGLNGLGQQTVVVTVRNSAVFTQIPVHPERVKEKYEKQHLYPSFSDEAKMDMKSLNRRSKRLPIPQIYNIIHTGN